MSSKSQDLIDTLSKSWIIIFNDAVAVALKYDYGVDLAPVVVADTASIPTRELSSKE